MVFKNIHEARNWFLNYLPLEDKVPEFWTQYDHKSWKFGDYILFQHIKDGKTISRPIYGIFTNFTVWDQALVMGFIQNRRAWTSHEIITNAERNISYPICCLDDEVEQIQFWTDNIKVLGHWKYKPSISELKSGLYKQYNTSQIRDIMLKQLSID